MSSMFTPEHLHVALNHVPLIGVAIACVPLFFGLFRRCRPALFGGLVLALACSASVFVVLETGESAAERFGSGPLSALIDSDGLQWLGVHAHRADRVALLLYAVLGSAVLGLIAMWRLRRAERILGAITLALALAATAGLVWVADAGGKIRHPEFRADPASEQVPGDTTKGQG